MAGLFGILHVGRSAILAQQTAVRVASQNITNAEVEGYSRQRADLVTSYYVALPVGVLGSGVRVDGVSRLRDTLTDVNFRRDAGLAASAELRHDLLAQVEEVLGEPSDVGLASTLDAFHAAWAELANQPASPTARSVVVQRGEQLASVLHGYPSRLDAIADYATSRVESAVADVNRISSQIAELNVEIVRTEAGGLSSPDLRDQRDRLIDQLAELGSVRVVERDNGEIGVALDGAMVVNGSGYDELSVAGPPLEVTIGARTLAPGLGSTLGGLLDVINTRIPALEQRLDDLARGVVQQVNALHSSGYTPGGATGVNFFDPAGLTARSITVTATSATVVAADAPAEPGNNQIALAMAALRGAPSTNSIAAGYAAWVAVQNNLGGVSFADHYRGTVADVAILVNDAKNSSEVNGTLAAYADARRQSVSGVSTDEELILVMQHQQAYAAAARLVSVVDEMMQTILDLR